MSKRGTLFGFILGAGAVAGVVALSKKTKTIEQLKTKYAAVLNEMKDYADMSGKHTGGCCDGDCDNCHAEDTLGKVGDVASVVTKRVHDILSDKEEFDKLINIFKGRESDDVDPLTDVTAEVTDKTEEPNAETIETVDNSDKEELKETKEPEETEAEAEAEVEVEAEAEAEAETEAEPEATVESAEKKPEEDKA